MVEPQDVSQSGDKEPAEVPADAAPPAVTPETGADETENSALKTDKKGAEAASAASERTPLSEDEQRYQEVLSFLGDDIKTPSGVPRDYKPQDHSIHPLFRIDIADYGGPLDLLVYLIRKHEIDVFDIPIRFVTERYLETLEVLRALDIDVAAEFLVLAADLIHIKSKTLLPAKDGETIEEPEEEVGDPRAELVRRLLEYQKYRDAAVELSDRSQLGRDVFARQPPLIEGESDVDPGLRQVSIFKLVELMAGMMKKKPVRHEISYDHYNIAERMHFVMRFGNARGGRFLLVDLMEQVASRGELVVTFIAVLESTKLQLVRLLMDEMSPPPRSLWTDKEVEASPPASEPIDARPQSAAAPAGADGPMVVEAEGPVAEAPTSIESEAGAPVTNAARQAPDGGATEASSGAEPEATDGTATQASNGPAADSQAPLATEATDGAKAEAPDRQAADATDGQTADPTDGAANQASNSLAADSQDVSAAAGSMTEGAVGAATEALDGGAAEASNSDAANAAPDVPTAAETSDPAAADSGPTDAPATEASHAATEAPDGVSAGPTSTEAEVLEEATTADAAAAAAAAVGADGPEAAAAASAETKELIREVEAIEREMAEQQAEEAALEERRAAAQPRSSEPWDDEPLPAIWVELTGKQFEGDIMDDYA